MITLTCKADSSQIPSAFVFLKGDTVLMEKKENYHEIKIERKDDKQPFKCKTKAHLGNKQESKKESNSLKFTVKCKSNLVEV